MTKGNIRQPVVQLALVGLLASLILALGAADARAEAPVLFFSNMPTSTQAGGHPSIVTEFEIGSRVTQGGAECECNDPKDIAIHTPAGVIANPHVVSECTAAELSLFACSSDSQVGFVTFHLLEWLTVPLYRVVPQAGQASLFAFNLPLSFAQPEYIVANARTGGDFGLDFTVKGNPHSIPLFFNTTVFWGVPAEQRHDLLRFPPGAKGILCRSKPVETLLEDRIPTDCLYETTTSSIGQSQKEPVSSSLSEAPFTLAPTTCVGPQVSTIDVVAYDGQSSHGSAPWPSTTGCDKLSFTPSLAAAPTTEETDSPSGLAVDLKVPQFQDPQTPSPSELKSNAVTLPPGFSLNPGAADGKVSCSDAQANFTSEEPADCPEFSKVGTARLDSSALPGPIDGYIYIADPLPGDPYRLIVTASGFGTNVKLSASVHADPVTGQLVTTFDSLPQAPFQEFNLHFFGSERGSLATPTHCGSYPVQSLFRPWSFQLSEQTSTQFFSLGSGPEGAPCPDGARPFHPSFTAGAKDNTAATFSPFTIQLGREDGDQDLTGLTLETPPGFTAALKGIPYCSEAAIQELRSPQHSGAAEQQASACPAASRVGGVVAGAGAGTHPVYLNGSAYLAGPYHGAPLSLIAVVPAVSGPYDFGNVVVRAALMVNETSAQVTAVSDPLPQILEGTPLRTRFIRLDLDRKNFALSPTNCNPFAVKAQVSGDEGGSATLSAPFQVANCADLGFGPKSRFRMTGPTKRSGNTTLSATITTGKDEANFKTAQVVLPHSQFLDNANISAPCTRVQFAADNCPASSLVGVAEAKSPLLDSPLSGPVYIRSSSHNLPDLVADLHGQFHIVLDGVVDQTHERIRTTFEGLPDVPVSSFSLTVFGGKHGILENSENLCAKPQKVQVRLTGQNGRIARSNPVIGVGGCGKRKARHRRARRHNGLNHNTGKAVK